MKIKHRLALIVFVPLVLSLALSGYLITKELITRNTATATTRNIATAITAGDLIHSLQTERAASALFIGSGGASFENELTAARSATDQSVAAYLAQSEGVPADVAASRAGIVRDLNGLGSLREDTDSIAVAANDMASGYTSVIMQLIEFANLLASETQDDQASRMAAAFVSLNRAKEFAGRERAAGSAGFASGEFTPQDFALFASLAGVQDAHIANTIANVPTDLRPSVAELRGVDGPINTMRDAARQMAFGGDASVDPEEWFDASTARINLMKQVDDQIGRRIIARAEDSVAASTSRAVLYFVVFSLLIACSAVLATLQTRQISKPLGRFAKNLVSISQGDYSGEIVDMHRSDEIGAFSRAIQGVQESLDAADKAQVENRVKSTAFNRAGTPMIIIDPDFVVTYMNRASAELFAASAEILRNETPDFDPANVVGQRLKAFESKLREDRELFSDPEKMPIKRDIVFGDARIGFQVTGSFGENGEHLGNVISWDDVTEERTNASKLAAASESQAIIEFTVNGIILDANQNFLDACGYTLDEIRGEHHSIFVDPEYAKTEEYREFWKKLGSGTAEGGEFKRVAKGGREFWILANYSTALDDNGEPFKVIKFASDITAEKSLSALASSQLDAINKSQAVIEFELDGTIIRANENFVNCMGYEVDEIVGKHHSMFVDPEYTRSKEYKDLWTRLAEGKSTFSSEIVRIGKGGRPVYLQAGYNPIFDEGGTPIRVMKIANDVTDAVEQRKKVEETQKRHAKELAAVVASLSNGLNMLSEGDLTSTIDDAFGEDYQALKDNFNSAVENLNALIVSVAMGVVQIGRNSDEVAQAADNLSRRTESQAATLEETAAALEQLTASVKSATEGAAKANMVVSDAKDNAEASGEVVQQAVSAMGEIEKSSSQISQIIGVIDDIAFQTNLLALNAGVEAARAGEAGRGFAVVASEVRALAQRSSDAAKEIKTLISESSQQVESGVELVGRAGEALKEILGSVGDIHKLVSEIANSSNEQAIGISEINTAVSEMDQTTQQNAAMVEETTAACHSMSGDTKELIGIMGRFKTDVESANEEDWRKVEAETAPPVAKPEVESVVAAAPSSSRQPIVGSAALDLDIEDQDDDGWEDF